jgi:hypothetical protein
MIDANFVCVHQHGGIKKMHIPMKQEANKELD